MKDKPSSLPTAQRLVKRPEFIALGHNQIFCSKSQFMQKKPLSHAQMTLVVVVTILVAGPAFYLAVFKSSPWLALLALALSQVFLVWKKRRSIAG